MANLRNERKFRNYISALVATFKTGEALENFTQQGLLAVHNHIQNKVGNLPPCLNQCSQNGGDINRWCVTCISWRQELENFIPRGVRRNWQDTASWCWPNGAKEIAEVFVFKFPGQGNRNINLKDLSTIFNVWNRCKQFQRPVVNLLEILKESRNELAHNNANMKLSNAKKTLIFQQINNVVSHPDIQQTIHNHADFLQTLHELENGELFMEDFERALHAIGLQNAEIETRLNDLSSTVNETNRKMLTHIFCLSVFIVILVFAVLFKEPPAYIAQQIIRLNNMPMQATMDPINERMSKMTLSSQAGKL
ncbi:uncharacterized protein LOC132743060 [Ruditapes philippinarum]|uniref:uncharacterized protein LOC132743060 n=1 Tax=Ruditapes philippinarum TaxID=129788 RepID=UPI00295B1E0C|nr:uncharacterized protein LOC132743060 [Ruditapes philippinarum]